jgi:tetratricopeptide (TPR) repeat protein
VGSPGWWPGLLRSASGDWAEAAVLWGQVTDGNPVNGDYWARLAEARFAAEDYAGAREAYRKVLELGVRAEYRWPSEGELPDLQPGVVAYRIACCLEPGPGLPGRPGELACLTRNSYRLGSLSYREIWPAEPGVAPPSQAG